MKRLLKLQKNSSENAVEFHDHLANEWSKKYTSGIFKQRLKLWRAILKKYMKYEDTWLDAGCGAGDLTKIIIEHCAYVIAFDASKKMLQSLNSSPEIDRNRVTVLSGDINDLSFLNSTQVNGIICSSVMEYLSNVNNALNEFNKTLSPNGTLIVSIPNKAFNLRYVQVILRRLALNFNFNIFSYLEFSIYCETKENFVKTLEMNGFDCVGLYDFKPHRHRFLFNFLAPAIYIYVAVKK